MATDVLIVEDEPDIRSLIVHHLEREGYRCRTAASGGEALARVRASVPDLLVLDLMLPGMDGLEVCRRLRAKLGGEERRIATIKGVGYRCETD